MRCSDVDYAAIQTARTVISNMRKHCLLYGEVSGEMWLDVARLYLETWPEEESVTPQIKAERMQRRKLFRDDGKLYTLYSDDDRLISTAFTFRKKILIGGREMVVLALGGVAVKQEFRGLGYGLTLVREAFNEVDAGRYPVALFQTMCEGFYRKFGCRPIRNRIFNSLAENPDENPFVEDYVMIYPASFDWPEGEDIDLCGGGY